MKIKKFRIKSYKSIRDSGDCYPAEGVTIFAGKNEAGKSSILEALEDFDPARSIREKAIPIENTSLVPEITISFDVRADDVHEIFETLKLEIPKSMPKYIEVCITKKFPKNYTVSSDWLEQQSVVELRDASEELKEKCRAVFARDLLGPLAEEGLTPPALSVFKNNDADCGDAEAVMSDITDKLNQFEQMLNEDQKSHLNEAKNDFLQKISAIRNLINGRAVRREFDKLLLQYIPTFILFSSFDDIFPNTIPLTEIKQNKWIQDLEEISDLDVAIITGSDDRAKKGHKTKLNTNINADFEKFWTQDLSSLEIDWDSKRVHFWIKEGDNYYDPGERSQGRRWHLAFYIRVSARAKENIRNIILIDEPGLYLHAKAQRDILKNLQAAGEEAQILISTHSTYLIEPNKLERIRLVQRTPADGTKITNKVHNNVDKETLTPILTAIGLELNDGLIGTARINNVLVEGPSDYYYLNAFKRILNNESLNFLSGGGSGNMPKIGTILQGWGCQVVYLYDNDQGYKDGKKSIKATWSTVDESQLLCLSVDGSIEDIFSKHDFANYVAEVDVKEIKSTNSEFAKNQDKVLRAKRFLELIISGKLPAQLSSETIDNARAQFVEIQARFK